MTLGLILFQRPHWLVLGAIRAASGACLLSWFVSFWGCFDLPSLRITLITGSVMGLFGWAFVWRFVMDHFIPAALLPYVATWATHGLVAGELLWRKFQRCAPAADWPATL